MKRRLAFVHGFTQTARSWEPVASAFRADCDVAGASTRPATATWADRRLDLVDGATALAEAAGRAAWIGYSMGGRLALHARPRPPDVVEAGSCSSAPPPASSTHRTRRPAGGRRARGRRRSRTIGVEAFLDRWLALPLFAGLPADAAAVADRLAQHRRPAWPRACASPAPAPSGRCGTASASSTDAGADRRRRADAKFVAIAESMHAAIAGAAARRRRRRRPRRPPRTARRVRRRSCAASSSDVELRGFWGREIVHGPCTKMLVEIVIRLGSGAEGEADGGQDAERQLQPAGGAEHRDEVAPGGAAADGAHRRHGERRPRRARAAPPAATRAPPTTTSTNARGDAGRRTATASAASPSRTASVRLPATVSVGMSRRLLTTSSAQATAPTAHPITTLSAVIVSTATYVVPTVATSPKNVNTNTSPSPR